NRRGAVGPLVGGSCRVLSILGDREFVCAGARSVRVECGHRRGTPGDAGTARPRKRGGNGSLRTEADRRRDVSAINTIPIDEVADYLSARVQSATRRGQCAGDVDAIERAVGRGEITVLEMTRVPVVS